MSRRDGNADPPRGLVQLPPDHDEREEAEFYNHASWAPLMSHDQNPAALDMVHMDES